MRDPLPVEELEAVADIEVGEALKRTRAYYGKSLEDIEKALRIRASQIDAIERGDMEALPGRVYAIGFVRSYAEYLDLDGAKVVQLFKAQYMGPQGKSSLSFPVPASETKTPALWIVAISLILASVFVLFWNDMNKPDRRIVEQVKTLPEHIEEHVNQEIKAGAAVEQSIMPEPEEVMSIEPQKPQVENMGGDDAQQSGIILKILGDSWVEIKGEDGDVLVSKVLDNGDEYFVPDSPGLSMSLGNAANVEIWVNGRALMPLGKDGDVRRNIPLNTNYLKTLDFKEEDVPVENEAGGTAQEGEISPDAITTLPQPDTPVITP